MTGNVLRCFGALFSLGGLAFRIDGDATLLRWYWMGSGLCCNTARAARYMWGGGVVACSGHTHPCHDRNNTPHTTKTHMGALPVILGMGRLVFRLLW